MKMLIKMPVGDPEVNRKCRIQREWLEERGFRIVDLSAYILSTHEYTDAMADNHGFPQELGPAYAKSVLIKPWSEGSFKISHWWFFFPPGSEDTFMLFKLTFA